MAVIIFNSTNLVPVNLTTKQIEILNVSVIVGKDSDP